MGPKLYCFGLDSRPNQGTETLADGGTAWGIAPQEIWAVVLPKLGNGIIDSNTTRGGTTGSNAASDGTTPVRQWYRSVVDPAVVVPPRNGGGTTSTQETWDETFLGSKFKST